MKNNKRKIIFLSVFLIGLIISGIFITLNNKNNDKENVDLVDNNISDENKIGENIEKENIKNENVNSNIFHYVEELVFESPYDEKEKVLTYNDELVIYKDGSLYSAKTKEKILEKPENIIDVNFTIDENFFYDLTCDEETQEVSLNTYDYDGNKKESIVLNGFQKHLIKNNIVYSDKLVINEEYIYILSEQNMYVYTKDGKLIKTHPNVYSFDVDKNSNYCVSARQTIKKSIPHGLYMINIETGEEIFNNTSLNLYRIGFSSDEKYIYGIDRNDPIIRAFDFSGAEKKTLLEFGVDSTYLLDNYDLMEMLIGKDDEIVCWVRSKPKENRWASTNLKVIKRYKDIMYSYYLYTKEEGERPKKQTTLVLTEPYRNEFIEEAIKRYELKYPDEHIEYNYTYNTNLEYNNNYEEYATKLTLDIIQGDTGDIVRMGSVVMGASGVAYQDLFKTDAFMDITDLIKKDKNYEHLNKDILNAITINDSIRGFPITASFNLWELNEEFKEELERELEIDLDFNNMSWLEILDLVKVIEEKFPDRHLFTSSAEQSVWEMFGFGNDLITANMPDLIDLENKSVDLNQEWFKELLIKFKECSKSKNFIYRPEYDMLDRLKGSLLTPGINGGSYYSDLVFRFNEYNKKKKSCLIPTFTGEKNDNRVGYTKMLYSINNRSERKEAAWKFLSFLLEDDIQFIATNSKAGTPISESGYDYMVSESIVTHGYYDSMGEVCDQFAGSREKYDNAIKYISHQIDYLYDMGDMKIDLFENINLYMKDELTLDEALKKAEEKILIRLNE